MNSAVLDASALLALLNGEPGAQVVAAAEVAGACISAVNLSEVVAKLRERGVAETAVQAALSGVRLAVIEFDASQAFAAGFLRPHTRSAGLSFGDRACVALGQHLGLPVLTTDRVWASLGLPVTVTPIR